MRRLALDKGFRPSQDGRLTVEDLGGWIQTPRYPTNQATQTSGLGNLTAATFPRGDNHTMRIMIAVVALLGCAGNPQLGAAQALPPCTDDSGHRLAMSNYL